VLCPGEKQAGTKGKNILGGPGEKGKKKQKVVVTGFGVGDGGSPPNKAQGGGGVLYTAELKRGTKKRDPCRSS